MEKNIAILMADLSGYTALTETHGAMVAADLIDRYIAIVQNCLMGDCRLHERTGDEIMVISECPDFLLATAVMIGKNTSKENNFLRVHGGLHYGKVLERAGSYFGSAINLTSRIAAKAEPGTYWCSEDYVNALSDKSMFTLTSKGSHAFKNMTEEKEIFELCVEDRGTFHVDPVCRMLILDLKNATPHPHEGDQYFCSSVCLEIYSTKNKDLQPNQL